jgi:hypothetical protein
MLVLGCDGRSDCTTQTEAMTSAAINATNGRRDARPASVRTALPIPMMFSRWEFDGKGVGAQQASRVKTCRKEPITPHVMIDNQRSTAKS